MRAVFYREYYGTRAPLSSIDFRLEQMLAETGGRRAVYAADGTAIFSPIVAWGLLTAVEPDGPAGVHDQIVLPLVVGDGDSLSAAQEVSNFVGVAEADELADDWRERCQQHEEEEKERHRRLKAARDAGRAG